MALRSALYQWFKSQAKPTAAQFKGLVDTFWSKDEDVISIGNVNGLPNVLNQKADLVSTQNQLAKKADLDNNGFVVQSQINTANLGIVGAASPTTNPGVPTTAAGWTMSNTNAILPANGDGSRNTANDFVYPNFPTAAKDGSGNPIPITLFPQTFGVARYNLTTQAWDFQAMPALNQPSRFETQVRALAPMYYNRLSAIGAIQPALIGSDATLAGTMNIFQQSTMGNRIGLRIVGDDAVLTIPLNVVTNRLSVCAIVSAGSDSYASNIFISNIFDNKITDWKTVNGGFVSTLVGNPFFGMNSTIPRWGGQNTCQFSTPNGAAAIARNTFYLVVFNLSALGAQAGYVNNMKLVQANSNGTFGNAFKMQTIYIRGGGGQLLISDLAIFDKFLTAADVAALNNSIQ